MFQECEYQVMKIFQYLRILLTGRLPNIVCLMIAKSKQNTYLWQLGMETKYSKQHSKWSV